MENLTLSVNADIDLSSVLDLNDPDENIGSVSECEKFVVFQIEGEFFALPAVAVKEVAHPLPLTHLPDSPTWLQGLSNLRGDIVAIVNFNLGKSAPRITPKSKIVIFKTRSSTLWSESWQTRSPRSSRFRVLRSSGPKIRTFSREPLSTETPSDCSTSTGFCFNHQNLGALGVSDPIETRFGDTYGPL